MAHGITLDDVINGTESFCQLIGTVPLGNSAFQTEKFGVHHIGPCRTYRQVILELRDRSEALNKAKHEQERIEIKIRQKRRKIEKLKAKEGLADEVRLLEIDIEELEYQLKGQQVLIDDARIKVEELLGHLGKFPKISREQFEAEELKYWVYRLLLEAKMQILQTGRMQAGTAEALLRAGIDPVEATILLNAETESKVAQLQEAARKQLASSKPVEATMLLKATGSPPPVS